MKILCVLYDDPKQGMPKSYPIKDLPKLEKYPDGMTLPSPKGRDFTPGELLGCVSGELGLRKFLENNGHELIVTNSKDGDGCEADKHIVDADIVISQPFFPYYLTKERISKAQNNANVRQMASFFSTHLNQYDLQQLFRYAFLRRHMIFELHQQYSSHHHLQFYVGYDNLLPLKQSS